MTRCQATTRSESLSTGRIHSFVVVCQGPGQPGTSSAESLDPQVCPHLVNLAAALWKQPAEPFTVGRQQPDNPRSEGPGRSTGEGAGVAAGKGRGERGETRRGPNITPRPGPGKALSTGTRKPATGAAPG